MSEGYFTHDSVDLFYTVQGPENGQPILLLHGWCADQTDWAFQVPFLLSLAPHSSQRFRIIAIDFRGHGRSIANADITKFDPVTMIGDVAALAQHLGVSADNPAIVMGHSLAGAVVAELSAQHPELVKAQVLVDPAYYMTPPVMEELIQKFRQDPEASLQIATTFWEGAYTPETPAWLKMWHQLRGWGVEKRILIDSFTQLADYLGQSGAGYLKSVKTRAKAMPRLVVAASPNSVAIERAAAFNETYDRIEILEAGHFIHKVDPNGFNDILENWLGHWGYLSNTSASA